jgi:RNA polymerase sigma factor for flagellar operon FliA
MKISERSQSARSRNIFGHGCNVDKDPQDDEFIRQYDAFVRGVVKHTRAQLGIEGDAEDLIAYAFEGLLEARRRFDPARGVQFKSFAYYRVRGAVLDGVRSMAYLPRRAYARLKASEAFDIESEPTGEARAQQGGDAAPDAEASLRAIDGILGRVAAAYCTAASAQEEDAEPNNPEYAVLSRERRDRVRRALDLLPDQERQLIQGHYIEGRNFDDIAKDLGLSKSWASRLHTRALARMRDVLSE